MPAVIYLRVSTTTQGESGLGLEAQLATAEMYCQREGFSLEGVHQDIASGADTDRPGLNAAIADAKRLKCPLVVAKLDRLSRDLAYSALVLKRVDVRVVDLNGTQDTLILQIMGAVAQRERELISQRTKAALAAKRARGETLGASREALVKVSGKGLATQQRQRMEWTQRNARAFELVSDLSLRAAARELNELRIPTYTGRGSWSHTAVKAARERLDEAGSA